MKFERLTSAVRKAIKAGEFTGLVRGMPHAEYHGHKHYVGSTMLQHARAKSARHFLDANIYGIKDTYDLKLGRLVHELLLEDPAKVTSDNPLMFANAKVIAKAARRSARLLELLDGTERELAAFAKCPDTGLLIKAKADSFRVSQRVVMDLKTTKDGSPNGFARSVANFGYVHSAAHYLYVFELATGERMAGFIWVPIEKESPHGVAFYEPDPEQLEVARAQNRDTRALLADSFKADQWSGYTTDICVLKAAPYFAY